jgi:molybdopterin synthase sulfur carrier subunit
MSLRILIPTPLRKITGEVQSVEVQPGTVAEIIQELDTQFPGIRARLCEDSGALRRFINVYVDGEDVRFLENISTKVKDGSDVSIVPAIAGGCF